MKSKDCLSCDCISLHDVRENIVGVDIEVPLLDGTQRAYVNFDNAASTPSLRPVLDKINEFMNWYSSVHRGTGFKSQVATEAYEQAHDIVCRFVGADPAIHTVIFGKNSTEALNKLARRLPLQEGEVVLTTLMAKYVTTLASSTEITRMMSVVTTVLRAARLLRSLCILL